MTDPSFKETLFYFFRHYRIESKLNRYAVLFSLSAVIGWLYFSFIEKSFVGKMMSGEAQMVDLVLGLPLVMMFTIIVYACAYWFCKLLVIALLPRAMVPYQREEDPKQEEETLQQEKTHGKNYWNKTASDKIDEKEKRPDDKHSDTH
ncbi:MAG TPA: hypothetical protein EYP76_00845 [Thiomicrorhabdus sp.]|nr:hypothetical protein [Thiomicrorhabdus sp.]